jgi:hypothetical protein
MKVCLGCKEERPLTSYRKRKNRNGNYYIQSRCIPCERQQCKEWYIANRTEQRIKLSIKSLKRLYNMTPDDFNVLLKKQNSVCAVCRTTKPSGRGTWHVDHDHTTGKIRGLLCHKCNTGIGLFNDNPQLLQQAKEYLIEHQ